MELSTAEVNAGIEEVAITLDGVGEVLMELDGTVIAMSLGAAIIDTGDIDTHALGPFVCI